MWNDERYIQVSFFLSVCFFWWLQRRIKAHALCERKYVQCLVEGDVG